MTFFFLMTPEDREKEIARAISEYSNKEMVDRDWLDDCYSDDNRFRNSFCQIKNRTGDFDLSLWYIAYGQSFGKLTDFMHEKMATVVSETERSVISVKKDLPTECPYLERKEEVASNIFSIDFSRSPEKIQREIYNTYQSEKFHNYNHWCNARSYSKCQQKEQCPLHSWMLTLEKVKLPYVFEERGLNSRAFFYFDTLCLINNQQCSSFDELFAKMQDLVPDSNTRTIVLRSLMEQVRGIKIKVPFFFQKENQWNSHDFDESELVYVDTRAVRVASRMEFPRVEGDLTRGIKAFTKKFGLTANQVDTALYDMGGVCDERAECKHGLEGLSCIFYSLCNYDSRQKENG